MKLIRIANIDVNTDRILYTQYDKDNEEMYIVLENGDVRTIHDVSRRFYNARVRDINIQSW